jgi:hypothetical protein
MDFVILDELGYLPFAQSGGQLLFNVGGVNALRGCLPSLRRAAIQSVGARPDHEKQHEGDAGGDFRGARINVGI